MKSIINDKNKYQKKYSEVCDNTRKYENINRNKLMNMI